MLKNKLLEEPYTEAVPATKCSRNHRESLHLPAEKTPLPLTKTKNCGIFYNFLVEYSAVEVVGQEQGGN
jgi:hypothetical protein